MRKQTEDKLFRVYLTDGLKAIADNSAKLVKEGVSLKSRYIEIIDGIKPDEQPEKPKETGEQIINRISAGLNALAAKKKDPAQTMTLVNDKGLRYGFNESCRKANS